MMPIADERQHGFYGHTTEMFELPAQLGMALLRKSIALPIGRVVEMRSQRGLFDRQRLSRMTSGEHTAIASARRLIRPCRYAQSRARTSRSGSSFRDRGEAAR